jgi:RNA polymerase-binding transcription factor DksA
MIFNNLDKRNDWVLHNVQKCRSQKHLEKDSARDPRPQPDRNHELKYVQCASSQIGCRYDHEEKLVQSDIYAKLKRVQGDSYGICNKERFQT